MTNDESGPARVGTPHVSYLQDHPDKVKIHVMVITPGVGAGWHEEFRTKLSSDAPHLDLDAGSSGGGYNIEAVVPDEMLEATIELIDDAVRFATRRWELVHERHELEAEKHEADMEAAAQARQAELKARAAALSKPDRGVKASRLW